MRSSLKILVVSALATFLTALLQGYLPIPREFPYHLPHPIRFSREVAPWETFFAVFGTMYAILVGFLIIKVLDRFASLSQSIEGEVNSVQDVRDLLVYFEGNQDPAKRELIAQLHDYVQSVSTSEWAAMTRPRRMRRMDSDTTEELIEMMRAANLLRVNDHSDEVALGCIVNKLADVTSFRTARISLSRERLPRRLKGLLFFMSTVLVAGFALMEVGSVPLHLSMVGAIAIAVHLVLAVIFDLDHPLTGTWNVSKEPLEDAVIAFARELHQYQSDPVPLTTPDPDQPAAAA